MNDPLDQLLGVTPAPDDGKLRQEILQRSTAILRRRRRLKQLALAACLPACFLAGMATMHWFIPAPQQQVVFLETDPKHETLPEPKKEPAPTPLSALAMENKALDSPDHRAELYRQAAELYRQEGDYASWVRCKDNALSEAKSEDLEVKPGDDFLTIALKKERQKKENHDARRVD
jgi:hypothetical protein